MSNNIIVCLIIEQKQEFKTNQQINSNDGSFIALGVLEKFQILPPEVLLQHVLMLGLIQRAFSQYLVSCDSVLIKKTTVIVGALYLKSVATRSTTCIKETLNSVQE